MIGADRGLRDRNISDRDIRAIQLEVEKDYFCFDPTDELSVSGWTGPIQLHYVDKDVRNFYGFNGQSFRHKALADETEAARLIPHSLINQINESKYKVFNDVGEFNEVDISEISCTCQEFLLFQFCQHLFKLKPCFDESIDERNWSI